MKKISVVLLLMLAMCLNACGQTFNGRGESFVLDKVILDGSEIRNDGGSLLLLDDGTGILRLGDDECEIKSDGTDILVNSLKASVQKSEGMITLMFEDTGLTYIFSSDDGENAVGTDESEIDADTESWYGRLYFSSCSGDWQEYDGNSIAVTGSLAMTDEINGTLRLFSNAYSDTVPVFIADIERSGSGISAGDTMVFQYEIKKGGVTASTGVMPESEINSTEFIDPHEYDWYVETEEETAPDPDIAFISFEGDCRDDSGSFIFKIIIRQS